MGEEKVVLLLLHLVDLLARDHKGRLFKVLGNHEMMNAAGMFTNVSQMGFSSFDAKEGNPMARFRAFQKGGIMFDAIRDSLAVLRIGDLIFVHGGISPEIVHSVMASVREAAKKQNEVVHFNFIQFVNTLVRNMFETDPSEWKTRFDPWFTQLFMDEMGILWNREFSKESNVPSCSRLEATLKLMGYPRDTHPRMMFLLGHSGQSFRCFAEIQKGVTCEQAGYTLQEKVFEDSRIEVWGGPLHREKGLHGITFFCVKDQNPLLCLLDVSQSRAFDMPDSAWDERSKQWAQKLLDVRRPSLLDVHFQGADSKPIYYVVKSKEALSR